MSPIYVDQVVSAALNDVTALLTALVGPRGLNNRPAGDLRSDYVAVAHPPTVCTYRTMQLDKVIERVKGHVRDGGVRSALAQLVEHLRSKALPTMLRSATEVGSRSGATGTDSDGGRPNYVFNISVAVAVGVPVNKVAGAGGEEDPSPDGGDAHGDGAPAIATASIAAVPDAAPQKNVVKAAPPRKARAAGEKGRAVQTKSPRGPRVSRTKARA